MPSCRVPVRCLDEVDLRVVARSSAYTELRMASLVFIVKRTKNKLFVMHIKVDGIYFAKLRC